MAKAVIEDSGEVMPVCAWVDGEYGISGVYLGVEAEIGRTGVKKVVEGALTDTEVAALKEAAEEAVPDSEPLNVVAVMMLLPMVIPEPVDN